jgi:hypothetical protein
VYSQALVPAISATKFHPSNMRPICVTIDAVPHE